jgi:hypothetical protein
VKIYKLLRVKSRKKSPSILGKINIKAEKIMKTGIMSM